MEAFDFEKGRLMWTTENYSSDLTDGKRALVEPLIASAVDGGSKRTSDMREVVDGLMDVPSAGRSDHRAAIALCSDGVGASRNQSAETGHGH